MKILADATLPNLSVLFKEPFTLTVYNNLNEVTDLLPTHDILLCRSTLKVTEALLANSPIRCVATASSGTDHIDTHYLQKHNIALFDAKGCNAQAVADYVITSLASLYCKSKVLGHKAGIIGVGKVGAQVVARLRSVGFSVICFDPYKEKISNHYSFASLADIATCDVISIHANLHHSNPYPSANLLGDPFLSLLKPGTVIINAARGGIVDEKALLECSTPITYCTDVYSEEPNINADLIEFSTLCTPHIAGHSIEAKNQAVLQVSQKIHRYYSLPIPANYILTKGPMLLPTNNWKECVLGLYNPIIETNQLKAATDKKLSFLTLRQIHNARHDFIYYDTRQLNPQLKEILGNP